MTRRHFGVRVPWLSRGDPCVSRVHSVIDARNFRACHQFSAHARYSLVTKPDRESNLYIRLLRISLEPVRRSRARRDCAGSAHRANV